MENKIKGSGSSSQPIQGKQPTGEPVPTPKTGIPGAISSITTTKGAPTATPPTSAESPSLVKPSETKQLSKKELKEIDEGLRLLNEEISRSVIIPKENQQALFNLADSMEFSEEQIAQAKSELANRSPEENAASLEYALENYIESDGTPTYEAKALFVNPKSTNKKDEEFSIFSLMLLLNQLTSSQRAEFFKGMQAEQANIQILFGEKKDIIKAKANEQWWTTFTTSIVSGFTSVLGGAVGLAGATGKFMQQVSLTENAFSQFLTGAGRPLTDAISGMWNAQIALKHDTQEAKRGGEEQKVQYNKQLQEDMMRQQRDLSNSINDTRKQIGSAESTVISSVARGV